MMYNQLNRPTAEGAGKYLTMGIVHVCAQMSILGPHPSFIDFTRCTCTHSYGDGGADQVIAGPVQARTNESVCIFIIGRI